MNTTTTFLSVTASASITPAPTEIDIPNNPNQAIPSYCQIGNINDIECNSEFQESYSATFLALHSALFLYIVFVIISKFKINNKAIKHPLIVMCYFMLLTSIFRIIAFSMSLSGLYETPTIITLFSLGVASLLCSILCLFYNWLKVIVAVKFIAASRDLIPRIKIICIVTIIGVYLLYVITNIVGIVEPSTSDTMQTVRDVVSGVIIIVLIVLCSFTFIKVVLVVLKSEQNQYNGRSATKAKRLIAPFGIATSIGIGTIIIIVIDIAYEYTLVSNYFIRIFETLIPVICVLAFVHLSLYVRTGKSTSRGSDMGSDMVEMTTPSGGSSSSGKSAM